VSVAAQGRGHHDGAVVSRDVELLMIDGEPGAPRYDSFEVAPRTGS
jgi:hypothetical protein